MKSLPVLLVAFLMLQPGPLRAQEDGSADPAETGGEEIVSPDQPGEAGSDSPAPLSPDVREVVPETAPPQDAPPVIETLGFNSLRAQCTFLGAGAFAPPPPPDAKPAKSGSAAPVPAPRPKAGAGAADTAVDIALPPPGPVAAMGADGEDILFFTERVYDGQVVLERAYMRLDGLLRELALTSRTLKEDGALLLGYETLGEGKTAIAVELNRDAMTKEFTQYSGMLTATRREMTAKLAVAGLCLPDAGNGRKK